jgi:hypothetical protein
MSRQPSHCLTCPRACARVVPRHHRPPATAVLGSLQASRPSRWTPPLGSPCHCVVPPSAQPPLPTSQHPPLKSTGRCHASLSFHRFSRALLIVEHPNNLPFTSCLSTVARGPPPHRILVEAPPSRPSSVSTAMSSSLTTFAMSHPSPQPSRAAGPFHLRLQPPCWLTVDKPPSPNREPPPHYRQPSRVSPSLRHLGQCHPAAFPVLSVKTSSRTHRR